MILTIASFKGGVGKTTTALHLAGYLQQQSGSVLCVDGDPNRSSLSWARRGSLPFPVLDERAAPAQVATAKNIVIDTAARPERADLRALASRCDLLILPCTPDALSLEALALTTDELKRLGISDYRILLTIVPPKPSRDGEEAQQFLQASGLPVLRSMIRRRVAFQRAALQGCLVGDVKERGQEAWLDYYHAGTEIYESV